MTSNLMRDKGILIVKFSITIVTPNVFLFTLLLLPSHINKTMTLPCLIVFEWIEQYSDEMKWMEWFHRIGVMFAITESNVEVEEWEWMDVNRVTYWRLVVSLLVVRVRVFLVGWLSVECDGIDMKSVFEIGSGWLLFSLNVRVWREGDEGGGDV